MCPDAGSQDPGLDKVLESVSNHIRELAVQQPSVGCCLLDREVRVTSDEETASVGEHDLRINPRFWTSLNSLGKKTLLVHEAIHVVLGHVAEYAPGLDPWLVNVAMDAVDNRIVDSDKTLSLDALPTGIVRVRGEDLSIPAARGANRIITIPGLQKMDWQEIYLVLADQERRKPFSRAQLPDRVETAKSWSSSSTAKGRLQKTLSESKLQGGREPRTPLEKEWAILHRPRLDWKRIIRSRVVQELGLEEYGTKPNTRTQHLYYSTRRSANTFPNISLLVDTSGSISRELLSLFMTYMNQLLVELRVTTQLIVFDQEVVSCALVNPPLVITPDNLGVFGHRGTDFRPAFEAVRPGSELVVVFTDLFGRYPALAPRQKVVWVTNTVGYPVPWGEVVHITA